MAVDLLHKKEKVCKELITYFLKHYRKKGISIASLYPFRPDFYKKMGFGYGTKVNQYRIKPESLPKGDSKKNTRFLGEDDREALLECYNRLMDRTSGMIEKSDFDLQRIFDQKNRIVAYEKDGKVRGYIIFTFQPTKKNNFLMNDLVVKEFIYESREALMELMTFLHTQLDQVNDVILNTQEEYFHYLLIDPRSSTGNILPPAYHETNIQGVGIMYRVINVKGIFNVLNKHNFGNQNCNLKITARDTFLKKNEGGTIVHFEDGISHIKEKGRWDLEIILDISDQNYVDTVNKLFMTETKPICMTLFYYNFFPKRKLIGVNV